MALPTFVAAGVAVESQSAVACAWPVGSHQTDDIGILIVESANEAVTLSTPAGFVEVADSPQGTGTAGAAAATRLTVFWCRATSGTMATPTIADSGNHQAAQILVFRGCATSGNPWDVTAGDVLDFASPSTTVTIPGDTTTVVDCLVLAICAHGFDVSSTAQFSGWANASLANVTERADYSSALGSGGGFGAATGEKASAGAYGATTATLANSFGQGRISIALRPPPSLDAYLDPAGIASAEAFGAAKIDPTLEVGGIASAEAFGAATVEVANFLDPAGIASAEAFGAAKIDTTLEVSAGIASAEAFGAAAVTLAERIPAFEDYSATLELAMGFTIKEDDLAPSISGFIKCPPRMDPLLVGATFTMRYRPRAGETREVAAVNDGKVAPGKWAWHHDWVAGETTPDGDYALEIGVVTVDDVPLTFPNAGSLTFTIDPQV